MNAATVRKEFAEHRYRARRWFADQGCAPTGRSHGAHGSEIRRSGPNVEIWEMAAANFEAEPRAGLSVPVSGPCRRYTKPPAAAHHAGLAAGERLSRFPLQLACRYCFTTSLSNPSSPGHWTRLRMLECGAPIAVAKSVCLARLSDHSWMIRPCG